FANILNSTFTGSMDDHVAIQNNGTGELELVVEGSTFGSNMRNGANDHLRLVAQNAGGAIIARVTNSTFTDFESDGIAGRSNGGTLHLTVQGSSFDGTFVSAESNSDNAISLQATGTGVLRYDIDDNDIRD